MSIVTGWGCAYCLHTVVGEGRARKEFLNPLLGPKSRSAVCGYCYLRPFTLLLCSYVLCPLALLLYIYLLFILVVLVLSLIICLLVAQLF